MFFFLFSRFSSTCYCRFQPNSNGNSRQGTSPSMLCQWRPHTNNTMVKRYILRHSWSIRLEVTIVADLTGYTTFLFVWHWPVFSDQLNQHQISVKAVCFPVSDYSRWWKKTTIFYRSGGNNLTNDKSGQEMAWFTTSVLLWLACFPWVW